MKIAVSRYDLHFNASSNTASQSVKREGVLLKIEFDDGLIGHSDCHPWPELGDHGLQEQLSLLQRGELTPLTSQSLHWARIDAEGRHDGRALNHPNSALRSHCLIPHICFCSSNDVQGIIAEGFTHVKIKMGRAIEEETERLLALFHGKPLKVRLDFNERLKAALFREVLQKIETLKHQIDFIEDPFPFDPDQWTQFQHEGWSLACDRRAEEAMGLSQAASFLIIKAAIQPLARSSEQTVIATSYLGHPLDQAVAARAAAYADPHGQEVHGLLSHRVYQPNPFSRLLSWKGPIFVPPPGTGMGFDSELAQLEWREL